MKRFAICLLLLPLCAFAETPEPPIAPLVKKADPAPAPVPTVEQILALRAQIDTLVKQEAAMVATLSKDIARLGLPPIAPFEVGRRGPPGPAGPAGKDGHSPVVDFGTGADADRLTIDGTVKGPHLTGPPGSGPPPPPTDALTKAIQDAYAATPADEKALTSKLAAIWSNEANNLATEVTNRDILNTLIAGRRAAQIGDAQLRGIRNVIDTELGKVFDPVDPTTPKLVTLTTELRAAAKDKMANIADILSKLK